MELPLYIELQGPDVSLDFRWCQRAVASVTGPDLASAVAAMSALEAGELANTDEGRMVGHYWLRTPSAAPDPVIEQSIVAAREYIHLLNDQLDGRFRHVLHVGVGGSALGPQLLDAVAGSVWDARSVHFIDNTDPQGIASRLAELPLDETLVVVVSKSGGTPETMNALSLVQRAFIEAGLAFSERAIAVTCLQSALAKRAEREGWLGTCPMWDWVGGRTSITGPVGLLPLILAGHDADAFVEGAAAMDAACRANSLETNPALALAVAWWIQAKERGRPAMVCLPYRDQLATLGRYLQQLVMESLGKNGEGLTVYGNKGSSDQHAYIQQLREGRDDFFGCFVEVLEDVDDTEVGPGVRAGDYLSGFLAGTRTALADNGRESITVTLARLDLSTLGALVALLERAVGFHASLLGINAYHQPGVEAGKRAAGALLELQGRLLELLGSGTEGTATELAIALAADPRNTFHVVRHLAANGRARSTGAGLDRRWSANRVA